MAGDMFLKLDGIKGESFDSKHKDEIDVLSWSWGMTQMGTSHTGSGSGTSKVSVADLHINKLVDKATPALTLHCCNGKHIKKGTLTVRKAGEHPVEYLVIDLEDIIVSSVQTTGTNHSGDLVQESISLNFAKFKSTYKQQNADGSAGPSAEYGWNIRQNEAV
jgi:type VI secretion system secreted protein Hcp